ncbi:uncharacterized protein LOC111254873 isoform X2 [Varroa destructor]|uniref:Condensin complex subunit 2 n=1 Tax=Varroa destructor TaxID=109461 RepID=A0A7M7L6Z8_VARDE|nr:uncharacterized protein LOC111254873 isoform X2 [Varroa destructor]
MDARNKQRRDIKVFGYYDLTGPYDVVRYVQEKKVTVENSFDFIDIEKTLTQVSQGHHGSEINFQTASLSLDASSKVYGLRVDNLHNLLLQLRNSFRPKTCVVPDTECESRTSPKIEIRKEPHASKRIRSNYVEPDLLKTTGAIDVNLDMNDFCGKILLEVSGQEGSMGRIMSFLPPADMHPIDITQQDHWFEAGVMEDMRTLRPLPDIPIGLPISRLLETFSMDLQSGKHFSQESLHTSLEQDSDIRKYKFDPDADSLSTKRTVLYGDTIQETQASNLAVLKVIKKENSEISVPGERFTIDGTPIRAIEARGRPRKFIDLPFLPLLERMTQPGDEPECKQAPDYNLFNAAVLSLAPSSIRLSNATLTKWTSNCKKLRHPDPVEIRDLTFDSVVERFSSLFFLESYKVSIQEFPDGSAAKVDAPDIRLVKRKCSEPEESKFTAEIKSESQVASSSN